MLARGGFSGKGKARRRGTAIQQARSCWLSDGEGLREGQEWVLFSNIHHTAGPILCVKICELEFTQQMMNSPGFPT